MDLVLIILVTVILTSVGIIMAITKGLDALSLEAPIVVIPKVRGITIANQHHLPFIVVLLEELLLEVLLDLFY